MKSLVPWIDALKSGEYKKGKYYLGQIVEEVPEYCCLGVLCELEKIPSKHDNILDNHSILYGGYAKTLPEYLRYKYNISDILHYNLSHANDINDTFDEVIKILEREEEARQSLKEGNCDVV